MSSFQSSHNDNKRRQPSKHARKRVREAFDASALAYILTLPQREFAQYAKLHELPADRYHDDRFYYHQDNGSDILAVAHLDHVQKIATPTITHTTAGPLVCSGALDDRLGAYVILEMLPKLGMKFDILLTTNEESASSTARDFRTSKQYNWMIEFDRGGTDVVSYQYDNIELRELVVESGAQMGVGSYSDIADLEHLGCIGLNWGVGYQEYHSARSHAWLDDTFRMVARFEKFWTANQNTLLEHDDGWRVEAGGEWVEVDCGHDVNFDDSDTYIEDRGFIFCVSCGGLDDLLGVG